MTLTFARPCPTPILPDPILVALGAVRPPPPTRRD